MIKIPLFWRSCFSNKKYLFKYDWNQYFHFLYSLCSNM